MKNIEEGEYVRTKRGLIAKYLGFEKDDDDMEFNKHLFNSKIYWYYEYYNEYVYEEDWEQFKENIVKHSKNIIVLIEVGDYVNGEKVVKIFAPMFLSTGELPYVITSKNKFEEHEIKSIVTKEAFAQMEYKVGE